MSLRRYLSAQELQDRRPNVAEVNLQTLEQAELDIDKIIASFYESVFCKAYSQRTVVSATISGATITLTGNNLTNGHLAFTVVVIAETNKSFAVLNNVGNVLTLESTTGITGVKDIVIYQLGAFPMVKDVIHVPSQTYKTITEEVKEAVACQYMFRLSNPNLNARYATISYSVSGGSYSSTFDPNSPLSNFERVSTEALDLLRHYTTQTI